MLPDKSVFKSLTAWGGFLLVAGPAAELAGFLPPGLTEALNGLGVALAPLLVVLGIRRAPGIAGQ